MFQKIKFLFFIFTFCYLNGASATTVDSLETLLQQYIYKNDLQECMRLNEALGTLHYEQEDYSKSISYHQKAVLLSKEIKNYKSLGFNFLYQGLAQQRINNYSAALKSYHSVLEIDSLQISNELRARTFNRIGEVQQKLGNNDQAFNFQLKALQLHELEKDSAGISGIYYSMGTIFYYQERYEDALKYYFKTKSLNKKLNLQKRYYASLEAIGSTYEKLGEEEKSSEYTTKALKLAQQLNYKTGIAYGLGNLASDKKNRGLYTDSENLYLQSIQLKKELNDTWGMVGSSLMLTKLYLDWEKPYQAIVILTDIEKSALKIKSKPRLVSIYEYFKSAYTQLNDTEMAFIYLEKYVAIKDSLLNEKLAEEMGQAKNRYEIEKKENVIALLKKENELTETNRKLQKLEKYIFFILAIFFLVIGCVVFFRLRNQRKSNLVLEKKNEKIQLQYLKLEDTQEQLLYSNSLLEEKNELLGEKNEEINSKNKLLESSNEDLAQFAYVASHDLKEPLRMISSYTSLLKRRYHHLYDESGVEFMHYIVDAAGRMENMLTDLLSYSRVGTQTDEKKWVDMSDVMVMVQANLRASLEEQNAQLIFDAKKLPAIKANSTHMIQLIQNLVSNAIKFRGERNPIVELNCKYDKEQYIFSVKDNGIGIEADYLRKVFEMFRRLHTREEYEGTGIGLATCKKIVAKHGGDIWVESVYGEGSTFYFSIHCPVEDGSKGEKSIPLTNSATPSSTAKNLESNHS